MIVTIFIKFLQDIDALAEMIRELFNLPLTNGSPGQRDQRRDSMNYGGAYYLFEVLAMELRLVHNADAMVEPQFGDYPYYLILNEADQATLKAIAGHLSRHLREAGLENAIEVRP